VTPRVGIVVPTLGRRNDYLTECLGSVRAAGDAYVCIVAPDEFDASPFIQVGLADQFVTDPGSGLAAAINLGFSMLPNQIEFVNWLGDDDILHKGSIPTCIDVLDVNPDVVLVYGSCDYIDGAGKIIWKNETGYWASKILRFGPDLIPQPGSLFRRSAFNAVGGLNGKYDWAFDFDLLIKLKGIGKLKYTPKTLASFRWHPESLSVEFRQKSVAEASRVRISHLPMFLRPISWLWEYPVRKATLIAGGRVTKRARRMSQ
jgi:GT2 family glycosyltransferase